GSPGVPRARARPREVPRSGAVFDCRFTLVFGLLSAEWNRIPKCFLLAASFQPLHLGRADARAINLVLHSRICGRNAALVAAAGTTVSARSLGGSAPRFPLALACVGADLLFDFGEQATGLYPAAVSGGGGSDGAPVGRDRRCAALAGGVRGAAGNVPDCGAGAAFGSGRRTLACLFAAIQLDVGAACGSRRGGLGAERSPCGGGGDGGGVRDCGCGLFENEHTSRTGSHGFGTRNVAAHRITRRPGLRSECPKELALRSQLLFRDAAAGLQDRPEAARDLANTESAAATAPGALGRDWSAELGVPGNGGFDRIIDRIDVLDAFLLQPVLQGFGALLGVDWDSFFPGGTAAQYAGIIRAGLRCHVERLRKLGITHAGAEVDEWLSRNGGGILEMLQGFRAAIGFLAFVNAAAFDELGVDRHFHFEHVHFVLRFRELLHAPLDDFRLFLGELQALFVTA